ncbi:hypothetical protein PHYSODRAFT_338963 [Phytophthora sojae]|uniref:Uncharacterized protein n=1 Tax=Phytophthora sojae (strain P6497) TaxID=1094619 RepID=G5A493_PHYSP|nr:hypothetical protein PHYSODRAFT_338963 [Phytophthora sojae]EGZ10298.1 hypothetical protein PHYSODRAFT_338963 [Phytophthora sojae]|eukprot:XP_009535159.1 hypothetical protein PHYSODRAFT_338963 [Phytophthora sojae]
MPDNDEEPPHEERPAEDQPAEQRGQPPSDQGRDQPTQEQPENQPPPDRREIIEIPDEQPEEEEPDQAESGRSHQSPEADQSDADRSASDEPASGEDESESEGTDQEALAALTRSRSEARRRQSSSPTRRAPPTRSRSPSVQSINSRSGSVHSRHSRGTPRSAGGSPRSSPPRSPPGSPPGSPGPRPLIPPLFPIGTMIPGFNAPRVLTQADTEPWPSMLLSQLQITAMIQSTLVRQLPVPPGWLFPLLVRGAVQPVEGTGYRDDLITSPNITALMADRPWQVLRNPGGPLTFDLALHRRNGTRLGRIADAYLRFEERNRQALWEATHHLPITGTQRDADPVGDQYYQERRTRRIRVGDRWRRLLRDVLPVMRDMWADLDLLLDPFFLHIPVHLRDFGTWYPGVTPTILGETSTAQDHPARQIPRLRNKFNPNVGAQQP